MESDNETGEAKKWLAVLVAPGSSLGGARPKANILDEKGRSIYNSLPKNDGSTGKSRIQRDILLY
jgi:serine/threonine-protein kinase HipA